MGDNSLLKENNLERKVFVNTDIVFTFAVSKVLNQTKKLTNKQISRYETDN